MNRHCFTLDLKNDGALFTEYEQWHRQVWPEILESITTVGIVNMQIYRFDTRLFMVMDTNETFSFEKKAAMDAANPKVQLWETLMLKFQQPLPGACPGGKWILMNKIFEL